MPKSIYAGDGKGVKAVVSAAWQSADAWDYYSNAPDAEKSNELYGAVAAVFRAANLTADAISNIPFQITDLRDNVIDTSANWTNKLGFLPRPRDMIRLTALSLFFSNSAYFLKATNKYNVTKELRYIKPETIRAIVNERDGLTGFIRQVGAEKYEYTADEKSPLVWLWWLDHTTELLPSQYTQYRACMQAAGALYYADYFVAEFFKRGGVKQFLTFVKTPPMKDEKERYVKTMDKFMRGLTRFVTDLFTADTVDLKIVGEGVDNLKDSNLHAEKLQDIAMAAGMPKSILMADSANYATANSEYSAWRTDTLQPRAEWIAESFNERLLVPMGYRMTMLVESDNVGTAEEAERAQAAASYYDLFSKAGVKDALQIAVTMVGGELPSGYEWESLVIEEVEDEPPAMEESPAQDDEQEQTATVKSMIDGMTLDALKELQVWRKKSLQAVKHLQPPASVAFEVRHIPAQVADAIRAVLANATDEDGVKRAFDLEAHDVEYIEEKQIAPAETKSDGDALILAQALNRAADAMFVSRGVKAETMPVPNYTINLTAQMPAVDSPTVTVNVPEQPPAVVNVTNEVQPTPIKVDVSAPSVNVVNDVQPAAVVLPPRNVTVKRNKQGLIEGLESE